MAIVIPALCSQIWLDSTTCPVLVTTGASQNLPTTYPLYLVSSKAGTSNGQSLFSALITALNASLGGTSWWCAMAKYATDDYRVIIGHNNGASRTIDVSGNTALWLNLGFAAGNIVVAASTAVYAASPPLWWWTPDMPVHRTGPVAFDPAVSYGVPRSAGSAHRSSSMVPAYTYNGVQMDAVYEFHGVMGGHKIRTTSGYTNKSLETFWRNGPALGRRLIWWRNRDNAAATYANHAALVATTAATIAAPSAGSATPYNHIEYAPDADFRASLPATPMFENQLYYWNVRLGLWVTENGETPVDD